MELTATYNEVLGDGEKHLIILSAICGDVHDKSLLDLCCGFAPTTQRIPFVSKTYVDMVPRQLIWHNENFVASDVFEFLRKCANYDIAILLDAIEHFRILKSMELLSLMESKSEKQILFTPLGSYLVTNDITDNDPNTHKSGWLPEMLPGYACLIFPKWHDLLGIGAFYAWKCPNIESDFERVIKLLENG